MYDPEATEVSYLTTGTGPVETWDEDWEYLWPVTIVMTRYGGSYEGGKWAAFNGYVNEIPEDVIGDDVDCQTFFYKFSEHVGLGATPTGAHDDLSRKKGFTVVVDSARGLCRPSLLPPPLSRTLRLAEGR